MAYATTYGRTTTTNARKAVGRVMAGKKKTAAKKKVVKKKTAAKKRTW